MGCGCGNKKVSPQSVAQQEQQIQALRNQNAIASSPEAVANQVIRNLRGKGRCFTDSYCPPGYKCLNNQCVPK